ncbi:T9SS type A sorting domain-containing protein [Gracilimonas mengyeensis]|uniref:T9SS type A sorting domain-containing protein n=1 Tax=Gracilimonas mengyeensis TaxID=1302730 RepID=UPI00163DB6A0|nr:T9SS type A sorting domain-containing protein [Gracilimonas mengyeensis]
MQAQTPDVVHGNLIQFNDNGAWCWYQDERAVIDTVGGKMVLGSIASGDGFGRNARNGQVEGVVFDLASRQGERTVFRNTYTDDHNVPAFLIRPDGKYMAMYCDHYDNRSRYRIYENGEWGEEQHYTWPEVSNDKTYSNLYYLSDEERVYNFSRADRKNPHMMISQNQGDTWSYGGQLSEPYQGEEVGYVNGYFKYWGNGKDRIDFIATEYHPRDFNTSMYHGYIKGGMTFNSFGDTLDFDITDQSAPTPADYTTVFAAGTEVNGNDMNKVWNNDLMAYDDGTVAALIKTRINDLNSNDPDHAFFYSRFDGTEWSYTYLGKAGKKMYGSEQDYTGLGALDPNDPTTIYISTPFDPRDQDTDLGVHEIFKGVTADGGETWEWSAITQNSTRDNFRPIIPQWNNENTALLWFRGSYYAAHNFDAAIVGMVIENKEAPLMNYLDANRANTEPVDSNEEAFVESSSEPEGRADNLWQELTGLGNGGSVFISSESGDEDAPMLMTTIEFEESGMHDVWVNFWADPNHDWRIKAGLSVEEMQTYRHMASQSVNAEDYASALLVDSDNMYLYQAYLGRIDAVAGESYAIYIDDNAAEVGSDTRDRVDTEQTLYDGISTTAAVQQATSIAEGSNQPIDFKLQQNYPNPFNPSTLISYELPVSGEVSLKVFDMLGREVATLVNEVKASGEHMISFDASGLTSGTYFYRLSAGDFTNVKKMTVLK